ncbi:thioesterase-like superfamily-domain-containing protein [Xylogone sp. PMI_703]|nr:thioesterase-like superfamily-domain-containing protein [Xylogone sp. PMI_703]
MRIINEDQTGPEPTFPPGFKPNTFAEATSVSPTAGSNTIYTADVKRDWCIGLIPHGGYLMSLVLQAVRWYFQDRHSALHQLDLITFHVEFLSKTAVGNVSVSIQLLKTGRQFSTMRVNVIQKDEAKNKHIVCLEALVTQGNIAREVQGGGMELATRGLLDKASIPKREKCEKLVTDTRLYARRPALYKIEIYVPEGSDSLCASPTLGPSVREQWVRWAPGVGTGFCISSLAFLADCFRPLPEAYGITNSWFPTLSYGMEVKRAPPAGGWEWLYLKIEMGLCIGGRHDYAIVIADEHGQVVAVSRHTALIHSVEKKRSGRMTKV